MKLKSLVLFALLAFTFTACNKDKMCKDKEDYCSECKDTDYQDVRNYASNLTQHIIKPIVVDPSCGCITEGFVKYVDNTTNQTVAMVKYDGALKDGTCYGWGYKVICEDGKCGDDWDKDDKYDDDDKEEKSNKKDKKKWAKGKKDKKDWGKKDKDDCGGWCKFEQTCVTATNNAIPNDATPSVE